MSIQIPQESSMLTLAMGLFSENPEDLADADLVKGIDLMAESNHYLTLENEVIELYLQRMNPHLLVGLQKMLNAIANRPSALLPQPLLRPGSMSMQSVPSSYQEADGLGSVSRLRSLSRLSVPTSMTSCASEQGSRINMNIKEDIASRETDNLRTALDELRVTSTKTRANLKAKLEEMQTTILEIREARVNLKAVTEAVNPITGRIPAEKFVLHLEEWQKKAESVIEKLRLRTSTLRSTLVRVNQLLQEKEELGENLHPIDFERLKIENKQFLEEIEQKNKNLSEMKITTRHYNQLLSNQKKKLQEQMSELSQIQKILAMKEAKVKSMETKAGLVEAEVQRASRMLKSMSELTKNYTAPDIMAYVKKQAEVDELKKALKVWSRRKKIQQTELITCKRVLCKLNVSSLPSCRDDTEEPYHELPILQETGDEDTDEELSSTTHTPE